MFSSSWDCEVQTRKSKVSGRSLKPPLQNQFMKGFLQLLNNVFLLVSFFSYIKIFL